MVYAVPETSSLEVALQARWRAPPSEPVPAPPLPFSPFLALGF